MKVDISITRSFAASHSLPDGGMAEPHEHDYEVTCGYVAEIDPAVGRDKPAQELGAQVDAVVGKLDGQMLNRVLCVPPTAEMVACWILAQLGAQWEWVCVRAYDGYTCRVRRADLGLLPERLRSAPDGSAQGGL